MFISFTFSFWAQEFVPKQTNWFCSEQKRIFIFRKTSRYTNKYLNTNRDLHMVWIHSCSNWCGKSENSIVLSYIYPECEEREENKSRKILKQQKKLKFGKRKIMQHYDLLSFRFILNSICLFVILWDGGMLLRNLSWTEAPEKGQILRHINSSLCFRNNFIFHSPLYFIIYIHNEKLYNYVYF